MMNALYTALALVSVHARLAAGTAVILGSGLYFTFGQSEERAYRVCTQLHAECLQLRQAGASSDEWADFRSQARRRSEPLIVRLSAKGARRSPVEQHLLDGLRLMMQVADAAPDPAQRDEQELLRHLQAIETGR